MAVHPLHHGLSELTGADVTRARALFEAAPANARGFLFAVLEGNHVGRVFVDDPDRTTAGLAHLMCDFSFLLGDAAHPTFAAAAHDLLLSELLPPPAPYGQMLFLVPTSEAWHADVRQRYGEYRIDNIFRKVFTLDRDRFLARHRDWRSRIPDDFVLRPYDAALVETSAGLAEFWSGTDTFLARGFGFALMHRDAPAGDAVSRCYTVFCGAHEAEINIETAEPYRRRGLATLTASAFIEHALATGMSPAWSCWFYNDASVALAERLGFTPAPEMPVCVVMLGVPSDAESMPSE